MFQFIGGIGEGQTEAAQTEKIKRAGALTRPQLWMIRPLHRHIFHMRRHIPDIPKRIRHRGIAIAIRLVLRFVQ